MLEILLSFSPLERYISISGLTVLDCLISSLYHTFSFVISCKHVLSYADGYQPLWDQYMRKIESIAGFVPYMTVQGNHEGSSLFLFFFFILTLIVLSFHCHHCEPIHLATVGHV